MAFELAINDVHAHPFSAQQGRENWKGLHNFMCRHPRLRLRKPRFPSAAKVKRFTKENVAKFFDTFEPFLRPINFSPHSSFNYNKTGLTVVQHKVCQVISLKGMRRVYFFQQRGSEPTPLGCHKFRHYAEVQNRTDTLLSFSYTAIGWRLFILG